MTDLVEIPDDGSENDVQIQPEPQQTFTNTTHTFSGLKSLQKEMEFRGTLLGNTWSELSKIMRQYQSTLIEKHEQYESSLDAGEQQRIYQLESTIDRHKLENTKLLKNVSELEQKLLQKDGEIVRLRTEVHKLRNEVSMKDSLIQKLQNQMAQEALEFQTEINSLKDMLENRNNGAAEVIVKRRRIGPRSSQINQQARTSLPTTTASSTDPSYIKTESFQHLDSSEALHLTSESGLMDTSASDALQAMASTSMNDSNLHDTTGDQSSFYGEEDFHNQTDDQSGDMMDDLLEQKPIIDPNLVEPHMLVPNMAGSPSQQAGKAHEAIPPPPTNETEHLRRLLEYQGKLSSLEVMCTVCATTFASKSHLKRHMHSHLDTRRFACRVCFASFNRRDIARRHLMNIHGVQKDEISLMLVVDSSPSASSTQSTPSTKQSS